MSVEIIIGAASGVALLVARSLSKKDIEELDDDFAFYMECEDPKDCEEIMKKVNDGRIKITPL